METNAEELTSWLQKYKESRKDDLIPDIEVLSREVTDNHDTLRNFDFGDSRNILHIAIERNHLTIIRDLINVLPAQDMIDLLNMKDKLGFTAVHDAAWSNRHEILREILSIVRDAGSSPLKLLLTSDSIRYTASHCAAIQDNYQVMESILDSLTDSEQRLQLLMSRDGFGLTVLHEAVLSNRIQTVRSIQKYMTVDHMYQLMKAQETDYSQTALHRAAYNNSTDMISTLMDPLTDEQRLDVLEMRNKYGYTAKEWAVKESKTQSADLLEDITTTSMMKLITTTTDQDAKQRLLEKAASQPLTSEQVRKLYTHSTKYLIPYNQKNVREQALIFYNEDDRDGAEEEADNLSQSLITTGCDVIKRLWSEVSQLQAMITDHLLQTRHTSSVLILCLMSHGSMGCLKGSDGKVSINNILKQVCDIIPQHIPLVVMLQACQGSRFGITLQVPQDTDPAVSSMTVTSERVTDPEVVSGSVSGADMKIDVMRPHTVLLQATVTGGVAYRGEYTGALADQFRRSNGKISIEEMHKKAVMEMERLYGSEQNPKITSTLKKDLLLIGSPLQS